MEWPASLKKTKHRLALMEILQRAKRPYTVEELDALLKEQGQKIWLSTIYRNLISLCEVGLVTKTTLINQETVYELTKAQHHHFAMCINCKETIELQHCALQSYQDVLADHHFLIQGHKIEIYGLCEHCRSKPKKLVKSKSLNK